MSAISFRREDSLGLQSVATPRDKTAGHLGRLPHYDLITFIALAQRLDVDFHGFTWTEAPSFPLLGEGGSGIISQGVANVKFEYAFKRFKYLPGRTDEVYKALFAEVAILQNPEIRDHPNILDLFGICWEAHVNSSQGIETVLPVLVFQKSSYGSLATFEGLPQLDLNSRISLCCDIGRALELLHASSKSYLALLANGN